MPAPNEKCPCGSGKKYKKCCYLKELVAQSHQPEVDDLPEPDAPIVPDPEFDRLVGFWCSVQKDQKFIDLMHERDAAKWVLTDNGIETEPFPAHIQQMRERERRRAVLQVSSAQAAAC